MNHSHKAAKEGAELIMQSQDYHLEAIYNLAACFLKLLEENEELKNTNTNFINILNEIWPEDRIPYLVLPRFNLGDDSTRCFDVITLLKSEIINRLNIRYGKHKEKV